MSYPAVLKIQREEYTDLEENNYVFWRVRPSLLFKLIQMCFWCSWAALGSYATAFFRTSDVSATTIGVALALNTAAAIIGQFFWGYVCDKLKVNKKVFIVVNLLAALMYFAIFHSTSIPAIVSLFAFLGFIQLPMATIMDTWILKHYHNTPSIFGPIRAWGSFAFAFFVLIYGVALERFGFWIMPYTGLAFILLIVLFSSVTPDVPREVQQRKKTPKEEILRLITNGGFVWFIIIIFLLGIPSMRLLNALPFFLVNQENAMFYMGVCMFATGIAEVPFMILAKRMVHITAYKRFIMALSMMILSYTLVLISNSPAFLIVAMLLNGISIGVYFPAMRQAVYDMSPEGLHNTTQGIAGVSYSMAGVAGNLMMGRTLDMGGTFLMLISNLIIQALTMCLLIARAFFVRPRKV